MEFKSSLPLPSSPADMPASPHIPPSEKVRSFFSNTDLFLREIKPPSTSNLRFEALGIPFRARHVPAEGYSSLTIWGELGYLPYSVYSGEKRRALIHILESTHRLKNVRFGVDRGMRIIVTGEYKIAATPCPDYLFVPFIKFIEESKIFIELVAQYL